MKKALSLLATAIFLGLCFLSHASDVLDQFLSAPSYKSSDGMIVFKDNDTGAPFGIRYRLLWSHGDYIREILNDSSNNRGTNIDTVVDAVGRFQGTNWSFRDNALTVAGELSDSAKLMQRRLGGMSSQEHLLSTIIGRGFTLEELATMKRSDDLSIVTGKYDQKIPIVCYIDGTNNSSVIVKFDLKLHDGTINYERKFSLIPFSDKEYVPGFLKCYVTKKGMTDVMRDIVITSVTNSVAGETLSPWKRYHFKEFRFRDRDHLYVVATNNMKVEIPKTTKAESLNTVRRGRVIFLLCLIFVALGGLLFYLSRKKS